MGITLSMLENRIKKLNHILPLGDGSEFRLEQTYGATRIVLKYADTSEKDITGLGTKRETLEKLSAMIEVLHVQVESLG